MDTTEGFKTINGYLLNNPFNADYYNYNTITMIESLEDNHLLQKNILLHNSWSKVVAKGWQSWEEEMDQKNQEQEKSKVKKKKKRSKK